MYDLDKTVFTNECIEATKRTDMATPAVLLTEQIKEKDGDKKKPAKAKTEDDTSVCNTDRTDHLKGRQREEKREEQADAYDPVADVTAEGEGMLFFINVQFSSECSCCLGNNVNRADPGAEKTAADNTVDKENDKGTYENIRRDDSTSKDVTLDRTPRNEKSALSNVNDEDGILDDILGGVDK